MEVVQQKSDTFRKAIAAFNQNKLLKLKKATYNGVETSIKNFENDFTKAKDVLSEFSRRSEELLTKIKTYRLENENKREIIDSEEYYVTELREKELKSLENNILKFQDNLHKEVQGYNQEKIGFDESQKKTQAKYAALKGFVESYQETLGVTFDKSKDNNLLIIFQYLSHFPAQEKYIVEIRYSEEFDRFLVVKTQPEILAMSKLSEELNDTRSFLKFLIKTRKEFLKLIK